MKKIIGIISSLAIISLVISGPASAQLNNHLILKKGPHNKMHFLTGDSIILMKNNFKIPSREQIRAIGEDYIIIREEKVLISDISGIVKERALHFKAAGHTLKIAGPGLILIDGFNSLIRSFAPIFSRNVAITGGLIFITGFILPTLQTKVYYMKNGFYLRIVPSDPKAIRTFK